MKLPWVKWFPREWLSEIAATKASLAARGLWREALDLMISNDTYMLEAASRQELAMLLRCRVDELNQALPNLQTSGLGDVKFESNGAVTLLSRRLQREFSARKNGRDRVAAFREKRRCNDPCNEYVPSVSVSAYSPLGNGGLGERDRNILPQLQAEVGKHYSRNVNARWSGEEEHLLAEVCRRTDPLAEWTEILGYYRQEGSHPRHSVRSLFEHWGEELDKARTFKPDPSKVPQVESVALRQLKQEVKRL